MSDGSPEYCPHCQDVIANKELRRDIDAQIQKVKQQPGSRERSIAITKLQEALMWLNARTEDRVNRQVEGIAAK